MKTILMIIILGTQNNMGGLWASPQITMQEFETEAQCQEAIDLINLQDFRGWENKIFAECISP